jgi:hypothetical protein
LIVAAVHDNEISKDDSNAPSLESIKSAHGKTIENEVLKFYNLVNHQDDALEPDYVKFFGWWLPRYSIWSSYESQPVYFPYYEQDSPLGQSGIENISRK